MADAALRVALDVIGITMFGRDFGARHFGECEVLEVSRALTTRRAMPQCGSIALWGGVFLNHLRNPPKHYSSCPLSHSVDTTTS